MIPFNVPPVVGTEQTYIAQAIRSRKICGDGEFTRRCTQRLESALGGKRVLLTTSCTSALEMAAIMCDLGEGDEVILPSFTFCSTANAFVQRRARPVFVDVRRDTLNIDERKIERAITPRTRAICVVHYAGVACEMDTIMSVARGRGLLVVEDAAQAMCSSYKGRPLGTIGDFGCLSFHETKNFSMGEGGAIIINREEDFERAEMIREKGTNRSKFIRGQTDKYTWRTYGSSYLPSDLNAAYLWAQLEQAEKLQSFRMRVWQRYNAAFAELGAQGAVALPSVPDGCVHNAHMYYLITRSFPERTKLIAFLKERGICAVFHYVPLHTSPAGIQFARFDGEDEVTTEYSERIVRLPFYYGLSDADQDAVIAAVREFYSGR